MPRFIVQGNAKADVPVEVEIEAADAADAISQVKKKDIDLLGWDIEIGCISDPEWTAEIDEPIEEEEATGV